MANPARATLTDLANLGPAQSRIAGIVSTKRQAALDAASDYLDGKLAAQYDLPLEVPYPRDIIDFECVFAAYRLIMNVGFDPRSPADMAIKEEYERKLVWADLVGKGEDIPNVAGDDPNSSPSGAEVYTATQRGYSERGIEGSRPHLTTDPFSGN